MEIDQALLNKYKLELEALYWNIYIKEWRIHNHNPDAVVQILPVRNGDEFRHPGGFRDRFTLMAPDPERIFYMCLRQAIRTKIHLIHKRLEEVGREHIGFLVDVRPRFEKFVEQSEQPVILVQDIIFTSPQGALFPKLDWCADFQIKTDFYHTLIKEKNP